MYKITTLNKISPAGLSLLTDDYSITEDISEGNGIILRSYDMHGMDLPENLLAIARAGAGVNNIPLDRCSNEGIVVFNSPGANANAVKELCLAGMLLSARNIPQGLAWAKTLEGSEGIGKAVEKGKGQFAGTEIKGKTLGIIGLGAIGMLVANAALGLGMNVAAYDPFISFKSVHSLSPEIKIIEDLDDLYPLCDYISIHVPVLEDTKGMINAEEIAKMKDGVVFLNFARDKLVNDADMVTALKSGKITNYVTDFPNDAILGAEGVIALPHLGASSAEAEDNCAIMATNELMDYLENGNITNSVNMPACNLGEKTGSRLCVITKTDADVLQNITALASGEIASKVKGDFTYILAEVDEDIEIDSLTDDAIVRVRFIK